MTLPLISAGMMELVDMRDLGDVTSVDVYKRQGFAAGGFIAPTLFAFCIICTGEAVSFVAEVLHFPKNHDMIFSTSAMGKCLITNRVICLGHNDLNIDGGRYIMQKLEKQYHIHCADSFFLRSNRQPHGESHRNRTGREQARGHVPPSCGSMPQDVYKRQFLDRIAWKGKCQKKGM